MEISTKEAKFIFDNLSYLSLDTFVENDMLALLQKLTDQQGVKTKVAMLLTIDNDGRTSNAVSAIKTIRAITGLGLKEAKDLYDELDPHRMGGQISFDVDMTEKEVVGTLRNYKDKFGGCGLIDVTFI